MQPSLRSGGARSALAGVAAAVGLVSLAACQSHNAAHYFENFFAPNGPTILSNWRCVRISAARVALAGWLAGWLGRSFARVALDAAIGCALLVPDTPARPASEPKRRHFLAADHDLAQRRAQHYFWRRRRRLFGQLSRRGGRRGSSSWVAASRGSSSGSIGSSSSCSSSCES